MTECPRNPVSAETASSTLGYRRRPVDGEASTHLLSGLGVNPVMSTQLLAAGAIIDFERHAVIFRQGACTDSLFFIRSGRVHLSLSAFQGRDAQVAVLPEGELFGESAILELPQRFGARAHEPCQLVALPGPLIRSVLRTESQLTRSLLQDMVCRIERSHDRIASLLQLGVHARVAKFLIETASAGSDDVLKIDSRLKTSDLAKALGTSREMVRRALAKMVRCGYIDLQRDGSTIVREEVRTLF